MINYRLKINFQDTKVLTSDICFVSGDVKSTRLIFEFYDDGKRVDISNYTLSVRAKRSDGVVLASAGVIENNTAIFAPENNIYAIPGDLYMEIALSDASGKYATTKIIIASVVQGLGEAAIEGADNLSVYVTLLNEVQSKIDQANKLIEDSIPVKGIDYWTDEDKESIVVDAVAELIGSISPQSHSRIFRGKNLGSTVTDEQKAAIRDGSFKDLFLGDYWEINGVNWRIVDMDYWYNVLDVDNYKYFTSHHLVIMPDTLLGSGKMKEDGTTTGGYVGSDMYKTGLSSAKTTITDAFGDLVLTHGEYLVSSVVNGKPSSTAVYTSTVELPSEIMMYGTNICSPGTDGTTSPTAFATYCKTQLALFNVAPRYITVAKDSPYWLRDVVPPYDGFARIGWSGEASWDFSDSVNGVRPYFCIG